MHEINIKNNKLYTDLVYDQEKDNNRLIEEYNSIKVYESISNEYKSTTISFKDITDITNYKDVEKIFIKELKKYLNLKKNDTILVIGLGNKNSTPDSLGPNTINNILVTRYLFLLGDVEDGYSNVCTFSPNVTGNTGIETASIIKSVIKDTKVSKVIVVDALKTSNMDRLTKTIQITNKGISPGSGIGNTREEISKNTMGIDIIAIGIPTVIDIRLLTNIKLKDNFIVTPTNIDFLIERLSTLLSKGINISLHKNYIRQDSNYY